ncbi:Ferrous iron transport periplasmic protein EfeO [Pseudonocardia sp. Ae406_Ps2]|uniref:iron uptake system protein EfeO n=1 Tax=unclassified Pseudonocardia TaxID=2619320 RepID=UPI00094AF056|nr:MULTISPECIES: iron uptake system protein EfeO [unclassified Pseudonocardia]OLL99359.1 Ferrous iron transport periplasmic protein EfeO [Pseudonocardia sp. Ae331_Ps2]OLM02900.1 Ferrous iron transport periplasmic protein EfeO [Pseudonocardia sp. Ae406_Ps2]OLM12248.1 Ferrous iron transport periplasmic protein EfeO [Pseudonocardia sp. Ae505_Ps2]OLM24478.1 Ferrous iron transport periplasmic protein EfeO [Pseudonocardia sp. Ae706_Ps2]OLM29589.1 Ferrous iron transport periplasmic protein EfeO [Pseu
MSPVTRTAAGLASLTVAAALLAGCTSTAPAAQGPGDGGPITVNATDTACEVSTPQAPAGNVTFRITNAGSKVTEFYLYATGDRIMGEVENIGPGLSRDLIVEVPDGGTYTTACKPGMSGDGIRAPFTVTGSAQRATDTNAELAAATAGYLRYVSSQSDALVTKTSEFAAAVSARDVAKAKTLFPVARTYYERIEPIAESFGDLDPKLDGREDDERDPGVAWTGFHRLEKDLWVDGLKADSPQIAATLVTDTKDLQGRIPGLKLTPAELANGAKSLLDEVATGKITGEEDRYSHTDLWDFQANVEGSQAAVAALRPVIDQKDPALGPLLDQRFEAVDTLLQGYRVGDGYKLYTQLTPEDTKKMAAAVDALAEPVSKVAGTVTA